MIRSMTGFARREYRGEDGELIWEIRSVNHRYLEPHFRLPEEFRELEPTVRDRLRDRLGRGKLDCSLRFRPGEPTGQGMAVDMDLVRHLTSAAEKVASLVERPAPVNPLELMRWPGVVREPERDMGPLRRQAMTLLDETLDELIRTRESEGRRLATMIAERIESLREQAARVRARLPEVHDAIRARYRQRIEELDVEADPERLEQELAIVSQKMDVDEELDRLEAHAREVDAILGSDRPVGRRLDFLMQELNREANTLGSKSQDADTSACAVELKVLIEQMREQVQNIE